MFFIPRTHPLSKLFFSLTLRELPKAGVCDREILEYVAGLLVRATRMENLFRLRDLKGKRIYEVGEMLAVAEKRKNKADLYSATGDCVLFLSGLFPEGLSRFWHLSVDDAIRIGKKVYYQASRWSDKEKVFRKLSYLFEFCVMGLNYIKIELSWLPVYEEMKRIVEGENYHPEIVW